MKLQVYALAIICLVTCGMFLATIDAKYIKRDINLNNTCSRSQSCGWEVYQPYQRTTIEFVPSPCVCGNNKRCVRTNDDISISAYVYNCVSETNYETLHNNTSLEE